jgi:mono/diheme cytochrome c family protein
VISHIVLSVLILLAATFPSFTATSRLTSTAAQASASPAPPQATLAERGRYLVEEVAKCGECHSPRDANGQPDHSRWLQGAPIWIMPVHRDPSWAERAPALAGFPSFTEDQGEKVLEQGVGPNGLPLRPPMHTYHLKHEDAIAIIAYLKTLPPGMSPQ